MVAKTSKEVSISAALLSGNLLYLCMPGDSDSCPFIHSIYNLVFRRKKWMGFKRFKTACFITAKSFVGFAHLAKKKVSMIIIGDNNNNSM